MFKIVQTEEDSVLMLTVVPSAWEKDGLLYWPPPFDKKSHKLRKDGKAMADYNKWVQFPCTVKKGGIASFEEANELEKQMQSFADTEEEEEFLKQREENRKHPVAFKYQFNSFIEDEKKQKTEKKSLPLKKPKVSLNPSLGTLTYLEEDLDEIGMEEEEETKKKDKKKEKASQDLTSCQKKTGMEEEKETKKKDKKKQKASQDLISCQKKTGKDEIKTYEIEPNLEILNEVTRKVTEDNKKDLDNDGGHNCLLKSNKKIDLILKEVSSLHIKFDTIITILQNAERNVSFGLNESYEEKYLPIDDGLVLNTFNEKLRTDKDFKKELIQHMAQLGGEKGNRKGIKIAYVLIDRFFTREFLTKCSWTGSTKKKDVQKIPFLKFSAVIDTFYKIVYLSDHTYTQSDNVDFLKKILKNSVTRTKGKQQKQNTKTTLEKEASEEDNLEKDVETDLERQRESEYSSGEESVGSDSED